MFNLKMLNGELFGVEREIRKHRSRREQHAGDGEGADRSALCASHRWWRRLSSPAGMVRPIGSGKAEADDDTTRPSGCETWQAVSLNGDYSDTYHVRAGSEWRVPNCVSDSAAWSRQRKSASHWIVHVHSRTVPPCGIFQSAPHSGSCHETPGRIDIACTPG
jgi:hypothetical protein